MIPVKWRTDTHALRAGEMVIPAQTKPLYTAQVFTCFGQRRRVAYITRHFQLGFIPRRQSLKLNITLHNSSTVHLNAVLGFQGSISTEKYVALQNSLIAMLLRTNKIIAS
jgi:hypothetical protein